MADAQEPSVSAAVPTPAAAPAAGAEGVYTERDELIFSAKLAEHTERFDEMVSIMKELCQKYPDLTTLERNLLSVAYKNAAGSRRTAWRVVSTTEEKELSRQRERNVELAATYRKKIESELRQICEEVIELLDSKLIEAAIDTKTLVFFYKMKGDYNRYIAEFLGREEKKAPANVAKQAYEKAVEVAEKELANTDPIRLGLSLNYSVFCCEILEDPELACRIAEKVWEEAVPQLETVVEEEYKDATLILQLLKDNLTLWKADTEAQAVADVPGTAAKMYEEGVQAEADRPGQV